MFAGIGGFDLGFERAGFETAWQVEINSYCRKVLERHFPNAERFEDVHKCGKHNLRSVDVICGGDPCQENSNARRAHDTISPSLGDEFIRIVDEVRPRIVLRENPAAVRADAPWPWWRFRGGLESLGYTVLPFRLRACCTGADHRRERLFLLAELQNSNSPRLEGNEREELARAIEGGPDTNTPGPVGRNSTSRVCRGVDRIPNRVDRLRALGNTVDPRVSERIARILHPLLK